jgi:hypothetical protein
MLTDEKAIKHRNARPTVRSVHPAKRGEPARTKASGATCFFTFLSLKRETANYIE